MGREKIDKISLFHYSRKDVQEAIFKFCQDRETVPRYFEGFGKRPDILSYPNDIIAQVKNGATSFHCSEELWSNPLEISTELSKEKLDALRKGWDLIIDIDCKWFDYSKKAALAVIQALKSTGVKNLAAKFSGGKGFHILVPWHSFPEEINEVKTKDMFPEWPRIICEYLKVLSRPILEKEIIQSGDEYKKLGTEGIKCNNCGNLAEKYKKISYFCDRCKISETSNLKAGMEKKERKCGQCRRVLIIKSEPEFYQCLKCKIDSVKEPRNFSPSMDVFGILGLDLVLVSSRHLFRCPYSLHEKTAFASTVLDESEIASFSPQDADPMKIKVRDFYPKASPGEAKNLLVQALEWHGERSRDLASKEEKSSRSPLGESGEKKFQEIKIDKSSILYPPSIAKILEGMDDGRKRALFVLINFFRYLDFTREELELKLEQWNKKNPKPLKIGYIKAQLDWAFRNKKVLPPNYDKPYYKDIGIHPDEAEMRAKNPVSYVVRKQFARRRRQEKPKSL
jgi:hypothetical protein